jgi:transcriptional regulator with XRE-family HTH domain
MALKQRWFVEDLAARLRERRAKLGLTQEEVAARMENVTYLAYQRWESGEAFPQDRNIYRVANALELDPSDLMVEMVPQRDQDPSQMDRIEAKLDEIISLLAKR